MYFLLIKKNVFIPLESVVFLIVLSTFIAAVYIDKNGE